MSPATPGRFCSSGSVLALISSVSHPGWDVDDVLVQSLAPAVVEPICQVPELTIPDNDPVGASTTINVPSGGSLADLNVT